jgi:basic amino acid/polyamine antiporter, APA family
MVGSGIYIRPASIAQLVGSSLLIMSVWLGTGLLSLAGALTYGELAAQIPRSGGEYAYLRVTIGELPAFLFGWMRLTVGVGTVAALAVAVSVFLSDLVPLGPAWFRLPIPWSTGRTLIEFGPRQLIAVALIGGLALLNIGGVREAGRFQAWVTVIKILGLLGLIASILILGHAAPTHSYGSASASARPIGVGAYSAAMLAAWVAYNGWAQVAMVAGETKDPSQSIPWAFTIGILVVTGLYVIVNLAYLYILPLEDVLTANSSAFPTAPSIGSRAALAALGPRVGILLPMLFMLSALGTLHSHVLAVPRVFFSMARDGLFPRNLARVSSAARTPYVAIVSFASVGATLAIVGSYDRLTNMSGFGHLLFYALNAFGLLWWRRDQVRRDRPARRRWVAVLFLAGTLWLLVTLVARGSVEILAALALLSVGVPVFALMRHRRAARALHPGPPSAAVRR